MATSGSIDSSLNQDADTLRQGAHSKAEKLRNNSQARYVLDNLNEHGLQPATIHSLEVHGARQTRRSFLDPVFQPLVDTDNNQDTLLQDVLSDVQEAVSKLDRFEIFQPGTTVHLSDARQRDPLAAATDYDIAIRVAELPRFRLHTGTDIGNAEGAAYGSLLWRNIFGGAESLSLDARAGTRTRSAYRAAFSTPVANSPDVRLSLEGIASATQKPWARHEEVLQGGSVRLAWRSQTGNQHTLSYGTTWRQVTGLAADASPTVRADSGDSVKSALAHTFVRDRRDNPLLPQSGYLVRTATELAGWGPLAGDVAFAKAEAELSGAIPIFFPNLKASSSTSTSTSTSTSLSTSSPSSSSSSTTFVDSGISISAGLRGGVLAPLPFGYNLLADGAEPTRINDRFLLGGPADVRGFQLGGLGPHDGADAVGGDVFAAGSVNVLVPVTKAGRDSPLRLQLFANGGRLVAGFPNKTVAGALQDLASGLPSTAAGVGLVYAHPVARFELNFSLPLVMRRGEESRKGLQVGVGLNFL